MEPRKCRVLKDKGSIPAIFHLWDTEAVVVGESALIGGHAAGQVSATYALVEYLNGSVERISPEKIRFTHSAEFYKNINSRPIHQSPPCKPFSGTGEYADGKKLPAEVRKRWGKIKPQGGADDGQNSDT